MKAGFLLWGSWYHRTIDGAYYDGWYYHNGYFGGVTMVDHHCIGGRYYGVGTMVVGTMVVVPWYNIMCKQVGHIGEA